MKTRNLLIATAVLAAVVSFGGESFARGGGGGGGMGSGAWVVVPGTEPPWGKGL